MHNPMGSQVGALTANSKHSDSVGGKEYGEVITLRADGEIGTQL